MIGVIINPGTGPVWSGAGSVRRRNADRNMRALLRDSELVASVKRDGEVDEGGRYPYLVRRGKRCPIRVDMPGLRLERVRYIDRVTQSAWDFPRLYVDGSSWLWCFAVDVLRDACGMPDRSSTS